VAVRDEAAAAAILAAYDGKRQIQPFTDGDAGFDLVAATRAAHRIRRWREEQGWVPVGRKVGFTNRTIWDEYDVHAPIWGCVYDRTVRDGRSGKPLPIGHLVEPRLEPEIMLRLSRTPEPGMDERALLDCVGEVSHGFEVVQSVYPGWRFQAADTVAAFALHGALITGEPIVMSARDADAWFAALADFRIALLRDGTVMDEGVSSNVLGTGPLGALRHLVAVLAADPEAPPLRPGEIVSTGTLTRALPIAPGESWSTRLDGIALPGITMSFVA
jgi:2-oxo-3-hexenedioate decarboxylase